MGSKKRTSANKGEGGGSKNHPIYANAIIEWSLEEEVAVMQKTVLMDSESIVRRVMSGLIQGEDNE